MGWKGSLVGCRGGCIVRFCLVLGSRLMGCSRNVRGGVRLRGRRLLCVVSGVVVVWFVMYGSYHCFLVRRLLEHSSLMRVDECARLFKFC